MATYTLRPDHDQVRRHYGDPRSAERLQAHYALEQRLAQRLKAAPAKARTKVYGEVYSELMSSLPDHPTHGAQAGKADEIRRAVVRLAKWLRPDTRYLELGCGAALTSFAVAGRVRAAYGLDVTSVPIDFSAAPDNFQFLQTGGVDIPLPAGHVDLVYSDQLMEHLHPEDAVAQLREVRRVLVAGGRYFCRTPNRATGPHDVSIYFGDVARGFHLKEYDHQELAALFRQAGFRRVLAYVIVKGRWIRLPLIVARGLEAAMDRLPVSLRRRLARTRALSVLLAMNFLGIA